MKLPKPNTRYKKYDEMYVEVDDIFTKKIRQSISVLSKIESLPKDFDQGSVQIYINLDNVKEDNLVTEEILITNIYKQHLRFNDKGKLESWLVLPESKREGFYFELAREYYFLSKKDQQFIEKFNRFIPVWKTEDDEILEEGEMFWYYIKESQEIIPMIFDRYTDKSLYKPYYRQSELLKRIRVNARRNL